MLCAAIKGATVEDISRQIAEAKRYADIIEIRFDYFWQFDEQKIGRLKEEAGLPLIFTLRKRSQGGAYEGTEEERLVMIGRLAKLQPAYLDIEWDVPADVVERLSAEHPSIKIIVSYHNFEETPQNLDAVLARMKQHAAHWYKIAVMSNSSIDMLRLMEWAQHRRGVVAVSMGAYGRPGRVMAPLVGIPCTFGCLEEGEETAPGQVSIKMLTERFQIRSFTPSTALYGLIGDPVDKSISDQTHNALMRRLGLDAVYVKVPVRAEELALFLRYAKALPFKGLSITMPLKELVLEYLDEIEPTACAIGAVNTLSFKDGKIVGYNTDGMGALNALEDVCRVKAKRLVILGAGGAAKAIAFEACRRGALVTIVNRTPENARRLSEQLSCSWLALDEMDVCHSDGYDIIINTTPNPMPIGSEAFIPGSLVMDIKTRPKTSPLTEHALEIGCRVVYGYRMFIEQAIGQYAIWFDASTNENFCRKALEEVSCRILESSG